jgi:hypothetical protein
LPNERVLLADMEYRLLAGLLLCFVGITVRTVTCRQHPANTVTPLAQQALSKSTANGKSIYFQQLITHYSVEGMAQLAAQLQEVTPGHALCYA